MPNYEGSQTTKNLGIRRPQPKRALYDPNMPNALVLYAPPPQSEHDKLKSDKLVLFLVIKINHPAYLVFSQIIFLTGMYEFML